LASKYVDADILVDGSPVRLDKDYFGLVPDSCRLLIGCEYLIINSDYRNGSHGDDSFCHVYFGATDPLGLTYIYLKFLYVKFPFFKFNVVVTEKTPHLSEIFKFCFGDSNRFKIFFEPETLYESLSGCGYAIGAPGVATWERMSLKIKSFLVSINDHQKSILESLHAAGYVFYIGDGLRVEHCLNVFSENLNWLSCFGNMKIDAFGSKRVFNCIVECAENAKLHRAFKR
jgi:UDP-2,4-diacetamido-2,4,6-trideoxy-beta-L-altropyranose hydrolase